MTTPRPDPKRWLVLLAVMLAFLRGISNCDTSNSWIKAGNPSSSLLSSST